MDLGLQEMVFLFLLALLVFGPAQLPKLGRQVGRALGEFKRASNDFKSQLEDEVHKLELEQLKEEARKAVSLDAPEGTVAAEPVDYAKLSHQPDWEHRKIQPPASSETQAGESHPVAPNAGASGTPVSPAATHTDSGSPTADEGGRATQSSAGGQGCLR